MIAWKCPNCGKTYNLPDTAHPPIRCSCGHVDPTPDFTPVQPKTRSTTLVERTQQDNAFIALVHSLWRELHTYNPEVWDAAAAEAWFYAWLARVPSFGCSCNEHFRKLIQEKGKQPDFSDREAFFVWGVCRHNDVNLKLGKRAVAVSEAVAMYVT